MEIRNETESTTTTKALKASQKLKLKASLGQSSPDLTTYHGF